MSDLEASFDETQVGGGGRTTTPPAVTPTRLRTSIKATDRDCGLISKAQICRTRQAVQSTDLEVGCASDLFQSADNGILVDFLHAFGFHAYFLTLCLSLGSRGSPTPKGKVSEPLWGGGEVLTIPTAGVASK